MNHLEKQFGWIIAIFALSVLCGLVVFWGTLVIGELYGGAEARADGAQDRISSLGERFEYLDGEPVDRVDVIVDLETGCQYVWREKTSAAVAMAPRYGRDGRTVMGCAP